MFIEYFRKKKIKEENKEKRSGISFEKLTIFKPKMIQLNQKKTLVFLNSFISLSTSGLNLLQVLVFLSSDYSFTIKLSENIKSGMGFSESVLKYLTLTEIQYRIMKSGEECGKLDEAIKKVSDDINQSLKLRSRLKSMAVYPTLMLFMIFGYLVFALLYLMPMMAQLIRELEVKDSIIYKIANAGTMLRENLILSSVIFIINLTIIVIVFKKLDFLRRIILGKNYYLLWEIDFCSEFLMLLNSGKNILDVIDMLNFKGKLELKNMILNGDKLYYSLSKSGLSKELVSRIRIFEERGAIGEGFESYILQMRTYLKEYMEKRMKLIEPLMILISGIIVASVMIVSMVPILDSFSEVL